MSNQPPDVSVLIVSYNCRELLADCLRSGRERGNGEEKFDRREEVPVERSSPIGRLGNAGSEGGRGDAGAIPGEEAQGGFEGGTAWRVPDELVPPGTTRGAWAKAEWWFCRDGKVRPAQPGAFPLATGAPARVGRLRAYGNSIVPQVAAAFIQAVMGYIEEQP